MKLLKIKHSVLLDSNKCKEWSALFQNNKLGEELT